jgi:soluble lytic murein transglycosylase-like protein
LYITKGLDSDKLYKHLENDLIAIIGSDNQSIKKLYHPVKANSTKKSALELTKFITQPANLTSKDPSVAEPVNTGTKDQNKERVTEISVAKTLSSSRSQRLASFYIDPQYKSPLTAIQRDLEHAPHAPTAARVRVVNANYPAKPRKVEFVQHNPKAALSKVYAIIKKHSPKHQAPGQLAHAIVNESIRQGVDPLLVAAVIKSESAFNPRARSHKGAQGLMQIMPATGLWLARQQNIPHGRLTDPGHNLRLGISYLKYLEESFKGDRIFALVAYNWGPGHLDSASGGRRRIPRECMTYALKIINDYKSWHSGVI